MLNAPWSWWTYGQKSAVKINTHHETLVDQTFTVFLSWLCFLPQNNPSWLKLKKQSSYITGLLIFLRFKAERRRFKYPSLLLDIYETRAPPAFKLVHYATGQSVPWIMWMDIFESWVHLGVPCPCNILRCVTRPHAWRRWGRRSMSCWRRSPFPWGTTWCTTSCPHWPSPSLTAARPALTTPSTTLWVSLLFSVDVSYARVSFLCRICVLMPAVCPFFCGVFVCGAFLCL